MSEALPDKTEGLPEPEARPPIAPPVQGTAPTWEDPAEQPLPLNSEVVSHSEPPDFNSEHGNRTMSTTAEKIGSAVGTAQRHAQRQMRRGLELVRRPTGSQIGAVAMDAEQRASELAREGVEHASRMMEDIEDQVQDARREAARRLDEISRDAMVRFEEARRRARLALGGARKRAIELGDAYPLQTIAAIAGFCFVVGFGMRLGRSRRG